MDFDVHLLAASKTPAEDAANADHLRDCCSRVEVFGVLPPRAEAEHATEPMQVLRHRSPELSRRVRRLLALGAAEIVHVEGFYLACHVPPRNRVPVLLGEQNVEYELWRQRGVEWQYGLTRAAEVDAWRRADLIGAVTAEDADAIRASLPGAPVRVVPDGIDHLASPESEAPRPAPRPPAPLLAFVGNFAYEPNVDAAVHLCRDVLPLVAERVPDVRVWLVGNGPPTAVGRLASDRVRVTGRVPDVVPYIDAADVVLSPLRIGGGVKVKTLEALRRGKALVATSLSLQGIPPAVREPLAVADEPAQLAELSCRLLLDHNARREAERAAVRAMRALPTWDDAAATLTRAYDELLDARRARELAS